MSAFVKQADVEQEQFDWGTIGWRCRPANTASKQLVVMDVTLEPGEGHAFHRHDGQEEMIIVKEGAVTQYIEKESTTLGVGDSVYLDAGVVHASYNDGSERGHLQVVIGPSLVVGEYEPVDVSGEEPWAPTQERCCGCPRAGQSRARRLDRLARARRSARAPRCRDEPPPAPRPRCPAARRAPARPGGR
jgi:quercetin dioxygenase-like cupin family protein